MESLSLYYRDEYGQEWKLMGAVPIIPSTHSFEFLPLKLKDSRSLTVKIEVNSTEQS